MPIPRRSAALAALLLPLLCASGAVGADQPAADKPPTPARGPAGAAAGKADAKATFARQAASAQAPSGAAPGFVGASIWSGRADESYRPFFQWELKLAGGSAAARELKARIATLGPSRQVLHQGDWKSWGQLDAGGALEVDYRSNCPIFPAYQVELAWAGGTETYLACDKRVPPVPMSEVKELGWVVAVNASVELPPEKEKRKPAVVTWTDWNVGGKAAREVEHTLHLLDETGKEVKKVTWRAAERTIAPGAIVERRTELKGMPAFVTLTIGVTQADEAATAAAQGFTGAKDIEIAHVRAEGGKLHARVRNGLDAAQEGVVVTVALQDKAGATVATVELPVGAIASGEEKAASAALTAAAGWSGYEVSWRGGAAAAAPAAPAAAAPDKPAAAPDKPAAAPAQPAAAGVPAAVTARGITLTPTAIEPAPGGLLLRGRVANATGKDLADLRLTVRITDREKRTRDVVWRAASLAGGADASFALACTVADVAALELSWVAGG